MLLICKREHPVDTKLLLPPSTVLPLFGTLWLLPISKNEIEAERTPVRYHWGDPGRIAESAWHSDRKGLSRSFTKMEETVGPLSTCGRELLREWRRPIGLIVSFMIFTASVRKIRDEPSYQQSVERPSNIDIRKACCTLRLRELVSYTGLPSTPFSSCFVYRSTVFLFTSLQLSSWSVHSNTVIDNLP